MRPLVKAFIEKREDAMVLGVGIDAGVYLRAPGVF
jgi:hypothetical protein